MRRLIIGAKLCVAFIICTSYIKHIPYMIIIIYHRMKYVVCCYAQVIVEMMACLVTKGNQVHVVSVHCNLIKTNNNGIILYYDKIYCRVY